MENRMYFPTMETCYEDPKKKFSNNLRITIWKWKVFKFKKRIHRDI